MTEKTEIFYSLFWRNKACRNLFLLSKEELLYSKEIKIENKISIITLPRIILSNVNKNDHSHQLIQTRTATETIRNEHAIGRNFKSFEPILDALIDSNFGKGIQNLLNDLEKEPKKIIRLLIKLTFTKEYKREELIIKILNDYGFIGHNIKSIDEIGNQIENFILKKEFKNIFSENNFYKILELLKSFKDIYINYSYRNFYESNQVLVNALHNEENYLDRLELFDILYSSDIIEFSREDSFIECTNCETGIYKGVIKLKTKPIKLNNLICPICNNKLNYYVPYQLNNEIYSIVKEKDGLILHALCNFLEKNKIRYRKNKAYLKDIEIDCEYDINDKHYIVECKMYKNNSNKKLKEKIKGDFGKLLSDSNRLQNHFGEKKVHPVLLINIIDDAFINELNQELKDNSKDEITQRAMVINIEKIPK